jgi:putative nucleotidyltransferase with HDIG domain
MQLVNKEDVPMHKLSGLICSDPAFSGEVLTVANSLLFAPRVPATSVLQAVTRLGTTNIQGICLTVAVRAFLGKSMNDPALRAIWRHNLACAIIAERLAALGSIDKDIAYTAGIMHDIGRLALAVLRPNEYAALLETHTGSARSILPGEREFFGMDHCEAGRQLITDWKLPEEFEAVVSEHHFPRKQNGPWQIEDLINVSCRMADTAGFAAFAGCEITPYPELLAELSDRERKLFTTDVVTLASEVSLKINAVESV